MLLSKRERQANKAAEFTMQNCGIATDLQCKDMLFGSECACTCDGEREWGECKLVRLQRYGTTYLAIVREYDFHLKKFRAAAVVNWRRIAG